MRRKPAYISRIANREAIELFAGIGLVRLALEHNGWQTIYANDIDPKKQAIYESNFTDNIFHLNDIHSVNPERIPIPSLLTASFPCTDLSVAGQMKGLKGKGSSAFWGVLRLLHYWNDERPAFVLFENVLGFLSSNQGKDFEQAVMALSELGYALDCLVVDAKHFTPQSRPRLFLLAKRIINESEKSLTLSQLITSETRPERLIQAIHQTKKARWHLVSPPKLPSHNINLSDIIVSINQDDPSWWSHERADYLLNQMSNRHREIAQRMIHAKALSYGTVFRRVRKGKSMAELRVDGLAGCLRTPRGGSGRQILFQAGYGSYRVRLLNARECARLQGVDDDYIINTSLNQALFGFGDAVCIPAFAWVLETLVTPLVNHALKTDDIHSP